LQSIWMVLKQLDEGRCEVENQYARIVPLAGNPAALRAVAQVYELREFFRMARARLDRSLGRAHPRALRPIRRRVQIRNSQRAHCRPEIVPMR
jgi:Hydrogenase formation hypA family